MLCRLTGTQSRQPLPAPLIHDGLLHGTETIEEMSCRARFPILPKLVILMVLPRSERPHRVLSSPLTSLPTGCPGWGHSPGMPLPGCSPKSWLQVAESTWGSQLCTPSALSDPACLLLPYQAAWGGKCGSSGNKQVREELGTPLTDSAHEGPATPMSPATVALPVFWPPCQPETSMKLEMSVSALKSR